MGERNFKEAHTTYADCGQIIQLGFQEVSVISSIISLFGAHFAGKELEGSPFMARARRMEETAWEKFHRIDNQSADWLGEGSGRFGYSIDYSGDG